MPLGTSDLDPAARSGYCRAVSWCKLLVGTLLLGLVGVNPQPARAEAMDLSLGRLRVPADYAQCARTAGFCPDQELFERLVSELAMAVAPPASTAAHTAGLKGLSVGLLHTVTSIQGGAYYWKRGTQGDASAAEQELNQDPARVLQWTRLQLRKGLPFGVEVAGHVGYGFNTSMWAIGGQLKIAILEGFRSGWGAAPDVAVAVGTQAVVGAADLRLFVHSLKLLLSKPYVIGGNVRLTPILSGELLAVAANSGYLDFDWNLCTQDDSCEDASSGSGVARFAPLRQWRVRWALGAELALSDVRLLLTAAGEAPRLVLDSPASPYGGRTAEFQIAVTAGAAIEF